MKIQPVLISLLLCTFCSAQAAVLKYDFSYQFAFGDVLSGSLLGVLQGDGNTISVSEIPGNVQLNGVDWLALPQLDTIEHFMNGAAGVVTVSLDGSVMDILAGTDVTYSNGFAFDGMGQLLGAPTVIADSSIFGTLEPYDPANWRIVQSSVIAADPIPEPATLALLLIGLAGLAAIRRGVGKTGTTMAVVPA